MKKMLLGIAMAAMLTLGAAPAGASTWHVVYSAPGSNSGILDLIVGGTTVTGISGESNGNPIIGLSSYAGADQQWLPTDPHVTFAGVSWNTASDSFGLGWLGTEYGLAQLSVNPSGAPPGWHPVEISASETPLPAALPLFASGLAGLGLFGSLRRKRKQQGGALAAA